MSELLPAWLNDTATNNIVGILGLIVGVIGVLIGAAQLWEPAKRAVELLFKAFAVLVMGVILYIIVAALAGIVESRYGVLGVAGLLVSLVAGSALALSRERLRTLPASALLPIMLASVLILLASYIIFEPVTPRSETQGWSAPMVPQQHSGGALSGQGFPVTPTVPPLTGRLGPSEP